MPHKHNADHRHHIPKMSFKVQNWPAYEAGLRRRGSLTLWIEDAALECWQTIGPSGQARYREAAIQTSLMLRTAFKLALRQTEGLMISVLTLMGLTLSAPDHSTVSRRAVTSPGIQPAQVPHGPLYVLIDSTGLQVYGAGQWLEAKHGAKSRRTWRKLHLAVDAASGMIVAQTLTGPVLGSNHTNEQSQGHTLERLGNGCLCFPSRQSRMLAEQVSLWRWHSHCRHNGQTESEPELPCRAHPERLACFAHHSEPGGFWERLAWFGRPNISHLSRASHCRQNLPRDPAAEPMSQATWCGGLA